MRAVSLRRTVELVRIAILVAEEILDIFQRDLMKDERVQPLTRATSQIHVVEEARHMRFAREEVARRTPEQQLAVRDEAVRLVTDAAVRMPVEQVYGLDAVEQAIEHAGRPGRTGKILLTR